MGFILNPDIAMGLCLLCVCTFCFLLLLCLSLVVNKVSRVVVIRDKGPFVGLTPSYLQNNWLCHT